MTDGLVIIFVSIAVIVAIAIVAFIIALIIRRYYFGDNYVPYKQNCINTKNWINERIIGRLKQHCGCIKRLEYSDIEAGDNEFEYEVECTKADSEIAQTHQIGYTIDLTPITDVQQQLKLYQ